MSIEVPDELPIGEWIAEPRPAQKCGRGQPKSRQREDVMCHVWRLVYTHMELTGCRVVSVACRQIMREEQYRSRQLKFTDENGVPLKPVIGSENLRKRFQEAKALIRRSGPMSVIVQFVAVTKRDVATLKAKRARRNALP